MQFDPGFFEREDVAAIGGEFGIIGEMTAHSNKPVFRE